MKKIIATLLGILTTAGLTHQAFAVDVTSSEDVSSSNPILISSNMSGEEDPNKKEEKNSIVIINGKEIPIKSSEIKIINKHIMIPLESTAEGLGFKITQGKDGVEIENDEIRSIISIGHDSYFYTSSKYIGMSAPQSLGVTPMILDNEIYVPIQFYNVLFNDTKAVGSFKCFTDDGKQIYVLNGLIATGWNKINNQWYYMAEDGEIKTGWIKDKDNWYFLYDNGVMASDTITPDGYKVDISGKWDFGQEVIFQIPNPIVEYKTLEEAESAVKFKGEVPFYIPSDYTIDYISVISNKLLQISYNKNADKEILLRMEKADSYTDISGDYNIYEKERVIKCNNLEVNVKGNNELIFVADWIKDGIVYSISISDGIDRNELLKVIESIK